MIGFNALLLNEEGELGRVVPQSGLVVPAQVELSGEREEATLVWGWYGPEGEKRRLVHDLRGLLETFAGLAEAPNKAYLKFARHWGVLELCERHLLPKVHGGDDCLPESGGEPIAVWRAISESFRALLLIASALHSGEIPDRRLWRDVFGSDYEPDQHWRLGHLPPRPTERARRVRTRPSMKGERFNLARSVNGWLMVGDVKPRFDWDRQEPSVVFGDHHLITALATQLMFAVARSSGLAICSSCGRPYARERRPARSRRNYCVECRVRRAAADRARDYRARRKQQTAEGTHGGSA